MTNEQLLVYLYGIYPDGGWTLLWAVVLAMVAGILFFLFLIHSSDYRNTKPESKWHSSKSPWSKLGNFKWTVPLALTILIFLSNLVPDKRTFLLLVATPTIVESFESPEGKLNKLNTLFDKALDKADEYIEKQ